MYIDAVYIPASLNVLPFSPQEGRIYQAPSEIPVGPSESDVSTTTYMTLLSIDVNATFKIYPEDFSPALPPGNFLAVPYAPGLTTMSQRCGNGSSLASCAAPFSATRPLDTHTGIGN